MKAMTKMKSALHRINSRLAIAKEKVSKLEDKTIEYPKWKTEEKKAKKKKN